MTASQLGVLHLTGIATTTHDHVILRIDKKLYAHKAQPESHTLDSRLGLENAWKGAESNIFGDRDS